MTTARKPGWVPGILLLAYLKTEPVAMGRHGYRF